MADFIQEMTGCSSEQAHEAAMKYGDEIWLAIDSLLPKPIVAGDKYMPTKPRIDTGMTPEQEELCRRGRDLQDKVNAVFSVAHSKTQSPQVPSEPEAQQTSDSAHPPASAQSATTESPLDADAKKTQ